MNAQDALALAIERAGGAAALARRLGISRQAIAQWSVAPAERVFAIEQASGGAVTMQQLRPDMFQANPTRAA